MRARVAPIFGALALAFAIATLVACPKEQPAASSDAGVTVAPSDAGTSDGASAVLSRADGDLLVTNACLSCHSTEMLAQQRLTHAQWTKVVNKMVGWGALLEPHEIAPLAAYLAARHSPEAGEYDATALTPQEALAEIAPLDDGPFANGDAERGRGIYTDKCSGCHGPEARGHIGVLLVDRPFLYRAADFAKTVRKGRGKMTPVPLSDAEIGDVLAHLRRLRNPTP